MAKKGKGTGWSDRILQSQWYMRVQKANLKCSVLVLTDRIDTVKELTIMKIANKTTKKTNMISSIVIRLMESTWSMAVNNPEMSDDKWFGMTNTPAEQNG